MVDFSKNYFELFGLPVGYLLDNAALAERYRALQKVVHPDRYANASEQERRLSLQQSIFVNEALETLKDPLKRAQYLLTLNGIDSSKLHEATHDAAFLMQQMELREALEGIRAMDEPFAELDVLMDQINRLIKAVVVQLAMQFEDATPEQLEAAGESIRKMQFLNKLHAEAEALEAELEEAL